VVFLYIFAVYSLEHKISWIKYVDLLIAFCIYIFYLSGKAEGDEFQKYRLESPVAYGTSDDCWAFPWNTQTCLPVDVNIAEALWVLVGLKYWSLTEETVSRSHVVSCAVWVPRVFDVCGKSRVWPFWDFLNVNWTELSKSFKPSSQLSVSLCVRLKRLLNLKDLWPVATLLKAPINFKRRLNRHLSRVRCTDAN